MRMNVQEIRRLIDKFRFEMWKDPGRIVCSRELVAYLWREDGERMCVSVTLCFTDWAYKFKYDGIPIDVDPSLIGDTIVYLTDDIKEHECRGLTEGDLIELGMGSYGSVQEVIHGYLQSERWSRPLTMLTDEWVKRGFDGFVACRDKEIHDAKTEEDIDDSSLMDILNMATS